MIYLFFPGVLVPVELDSSQFKVSFFVTLRTHLESSGKGSVVIGTYST